MATKGLQLSCNQATEACMHTCSHAHTHSPESFELDVVHQKIPGLDQLLDLPQQLFFLLPVLVGLVLV